MARSATLRDRHAHALDASRPVAPSGPYPSCISHRVHGVREGFRLFLEARLGGQAGWPIVIGVACCGQGVFVATSAPSPGACPTLLWRPTARAAAKLGPAREVVLWLRRNLDAFPL